jgi:hypothetical protein
LIDIYDPRVYTSNKWSNGPYIPSLFQATKAEFAEQYLEAMKNEIQSLIPQTTWKMIPRSKATHVIKSTWVFKLKHFSDGSASKFKACFSVHGDMQKRRHILL